MSENKPRAHSTIDNQNEIWMDMKGAWLTYGLSVTFLHLLILSIPIFATATAWTLTNLVHDVVTSNSYFFLCETITRL